ncbi:hypothetical protein GCM10010274_39770 [Streptomyces lavendofoliae]|uniref:Uncharacterized protein n=1 Tax=Streptomyces lavendofoliae TaxID=67314 RepID=A0A918HZF8_9ACTN|nr:hypothetical protein GCM10010274_39770 [Streptomyces lavendofoliae]
MVIVPTASASAAAALIIFTLRMVPPCWVLRCADDLRLAAAPTAVNGFPVARRAAPRETTGDQPPGSGESTDPEHRHVAATGSGPARPAPPRLRDAVGEWRALGRRPGAPAALGRGPVVADVTAGVAQGPSVRWWPWESW